MAETIIGAITAFNWVSTVIAGKAAPRAAVARTDPAYDS